MSLDSELRDTLIAHGAALVGVAELSALPPDGRQGMPRAVAVAAAYDPAVIAGLTQGPTLAYYAAYQRLNDLLDELAQVGAAFLRERRHAAIGRAATMQDVNWTTHTTALPHKTVATRAGLGWIGKTALLVTPTHGSAIRLTTILTDAPLTVGRPTNVSRCGPCLACTQACPAHAATGENWRLGLPREAYYNAHACCDVATARSQAVGIDDTICGICIAVCPWTQRYIARPGSRGADSDHE